MAKYGSADLKIEFDNSSGDLQNVSNYIDEVNDVDIEAMLQESHAFGDSWVEQFFTGIKRVGDITLGGFYDDTVTVGPDALFIAIGDSRELKFSWDGSSKNTLFNTIIKNYTRTPSRGELTRFSVTLAVTGSVSEN